MHILSPSILSKGTVGVSKFVRIRGQFLIFPSTGAQSLRACVRELRPDVAPHVQPRHGVVDLVSSHDVGLLQREEVHLHPCSDPASHFDPPLRLLLHDKVLPLLPVDSARRCLPGTEGDPQYGRRVQVICRA